MKILLNIVNFLVYVYKKGYVYCDLKSNNVVFFNGVGYLIDFGKVCWLVLFLVKRYNKIYFYIVLEVFYGLFCSK